MLRNNGCCNASVCRHGGSARRSVSTLTVASARSVDVK